MMAKKTMSFYDFMMRHYLVDEDRYALAANMKKLSRKHPELKQIDSLSDLMIMASVLDDPDARAAVSGDLWCEYCFRTGRPMTGQE